MKIFIASDHAGFETKSNILKYLKKNKSLSLIDLGPSNTERVDYPDFSDAVCTQLKDTNSTQDSLGILICGSGQGMAMRANKYKHIRAALCTNVELAKLSRAHNKANVLCLGARTTEEGLLLKIIDTFLTTDFEGGRHQKRVEKISAPTNV